MLLTWNDKGVRAGEDTGLGRFPDDVAINSAWLAISMIAATLLAWLPPPHPRR